MALTATANEKVVKDAIDRLAMSKPFLYRSSFNRPNLSYEVRRKDKKTIDVIADYVAQRPNDSGVIYCLSRKDCEQVSEKLRNKFDEKGMRNIGVSYYHAELDPSERNRRHHLWLSGRLSILCATIAFGMGIDKPDVRYVMHYSMPKSITHYYQESGRAGRDGNNADCILFYAYKDKKILETMIRKSSNDPNCPGMRRKIDQLYSCLRYCENEFLCRRTMQLEFFGERFEREKCNKTCDNCKSGKIAEKRDLTTEALTIMELLDSLLEQKNGHGAAMGQVTELFRGSKSKSATKFINVKQLRGYGAGKKYKKGDADRIMHAMVFEGLLMERAEQNRSGFTSDFLYLGPTAEAARSGRFQFFVNFPSATKANDISTQEIGICNTVTKKTKKNKGQKKEKRSKLVVKGGRFEVPSVQNLCDSDDDSVTVLTTTNSSDKQHGKTSRLHSLTSTSPSNSVLPTHHFEKLKERIKKLVSMWADEEKMNGNKVFYWNIMNLNAIETIASQIPLTIDELKDVAVLGEKIVEEYGQRLIKNLNAFVEQNSLHKYIDKLEKEKKRRKLSHPYVPKETGFHPAQKKEVNSEFETDIDFSMLEIPGVIGTGTSIAQKQHSNVESNYFKKP